MHSSLSSYSEFSNLCNREFKWAMEFDLVLDRDEIGGKTLGFLLVGWFICSTIRNAKVDDDDDDTVVIALCVISHG